MFRQKNNINHPLPTAQSPEWVNGFLYWVRQSQLLFGSNKRQPSYMRPVLSVLQHGPRLIVLPATRQRNPSFYHLPADKIVWNSRKQSPDSYLSYPYEALSMDKLPKKAGTIPHAERINIMSWIKDQ